MRGIYLSQTNKGKKMFSIRYRLTVTAVMFFFFMTAGSIGLVEGAHAAEKKTGQPAVPVRVAAVQERTVTEQVSLIGTTEPIRESMVASEVSGRVEVFYVKAGDFIKEKSFLAVLGATDLKLRLRAAEAAREGINAQLILAEKELDRLSTLRNTKSVAANQFDEAYFNHSVLTQELLRSDAEIERLAQELSKKNVAAPFTGFVAEEHTQVGEWVTTGGGIVTLVDLSSILIKVDVPEKDAVKIVPHSNVDVVIKSLSEKPLSAEVVAVLPTGNADARTFPVHIKLSNSDLRIKSGMEAVVTFKVGERRKALLVSKDAVVAAGNQRMVYRVVSEQVLPVPVKVLGYYGNDAAIEGDLKPGQQVVIRGNERLRPGQTVQVIE